MNPRHIQYSDYGGRGILLCPEWAAFEPFRDWALSNGYADSLSIDRKENDGPYSPGNCRWASRVAQARNKRVSHIAPDGRHWLEVAAAHGVSRWCYHTRVHAGWPREQAATWPKGKWRGELLERGSDGRLLPRN